MAGKQTPAPGNINSAGNGESVGIFVKPTKANIPKRAEYVASDNAPCEGVNLLVLMCRGTHAKIADTAILRKCQVGGNCSST